MHEHLFGKYGQKPTSSCTYTEPMNNGLSEVYDVIKKIGTFSLFLLLHTFYMTLLLVAI